MIKAPSYYGCGVGLWLEEQMIVTVYAYYFLMLAKWGLGPIVVMIENELL